MIVDDNLLNKLEKLAMIRIEPQKRGDFKDELSAIIAKMDSLQEVNTNDISLQKDEKTPMRVDIPENAEIRNQVLNQAPKSENGYFIVPKVIG